MASLTDRPIRNPEIVLREEFDDWAILFDPDTGQGNTLDPVSVFIWKQLDGEHSITDILAKLRAECEDAPGDAEEKVVAFIDDLVENGLAGYELPQK